MKCVASLNTTSKMSYILANAFCIFCYLKCCFNSGLLMTPCKPITNRSNLLSSCPWPSWSQFNSKAHWQNYCQTDWLIQWLFHPVLIALCGDYMIMWWTDFVVVYIFVMVISDGFWMAACPSPWFHSSILFHHWNCFSISLIWKS